MAHKEVEVKLLEVDKEAMIEKLLSLGAKKIFNDVLRMHSFKPQKGMLLRVREEGDETFLVVKKQLASAVAVVNDEYSVKVDDFEKMVQIIELLGFPNKWQYDKHRTSYQLENVRFEFDTLLGAYDFVPTYLELEAPSEEVLFAMLDKLGLKKSDVKSWTGGDVIRYYEKK